MISWAPCTIAALSNSCTSRPTTCLLLSYLVLPCRDFIVLFFLALSRPVLSCLDCLVLFCPVLSGPVASRPIWPRLGKTRNLTKNEKFGKKKTKNLDERERESDVKFS